MNTTSINHSPAVLVAAATGLAGTLLALTVNGAHAIPDPIDPAPVVHRTIDTHDDDAEHACFIEPHVWNEALDGPLPRC